MCVVLVERAWVVLWLRCNHFRNLRGRGGSTRGGAAVGSAVSNAAVVLWYDGEPVRQLHAMGGDGLVLREAEFN